MYVKIILLAPPHTRPLVVKQFAHLSWDFEVEDHVKVPISMTKCPNKMSKRIHLIYVDCLLPIYLLLQGGQSCKGGGLCSTIPLGEVDGRISQKPSSHLSTKTRGPF